MSKRRARNPIEKPEAEPSAIWIKTQPRLDGAGYVVTLEVDDDTALTLTPAVALNYAEALLTVVQRAEFDAAVVKQLTGLVKGPETAAAQIVLDLRRDRPPVSNLSDPLSFDGGVSAATGEPFIMIMVKGKQVGQWTLADARGHALHAIEAAGAADLDAAYVRVLTTLVGLDRNLAEQVVDDLGNHRATFKFS